MTKNSSVVVSIVIFSSVPLLVRELQTQDTCKIREVGTLLVKEQMWNVPLSIFCLKISKFASSNPITHLPPTIYLPCHVTAALSLGPRVLGPCVRSSVFWSHLHAWGCWLQVIRLAVYRVLPSFKNGTISGIQSHIITTSPVNLSCRCRFSLLCVGHLRILPGAPPQDAGLGAGVSQPRALHAAFQTPAPSSHRAHGHRQHETNFLAAL